MTDRIKGFIVTLDDDMRSDDAEYVIHAIEMIKHVHSVKPVVSNFDDCMNRERVRLELWNKIYDLFWPKKETKS